MGCAKEGEATGITSSENSVSRGVRKDNFATGVESSRLRLLVAAANKSSGDLGGPTGCTATGALSSVSEKTIVELRTRSCARFDAAEASRDFDSCGGSSHVPVVYCKCPAVWTNGKPAASTILLISAAVVVVGNLSARRRFDLFEGPDR